MNSQKSGSKADVAPATRPIMEITMYQPSFRNVAAALSLACLPFVFASEARSAILQPRAAILAARTHDYAWCLQIHTEDRTDCSFSTRSQCEATAAGGLGECVLIAPSAQPGN